jgi:LDH2 family malate/lactate/ureidoglycolate dehydrogenase
MSVIVPADRLRAFAAGLLAACGVPEADAATAAAILVEADLRGVHSHGVLGLLVYTKRLRAGGIAPRASISVAADRGAALLVDGGNGLGQVVGAAAMGRAIARARETSVALVGVRNSNHLGMNGAYAMMALPHDMIGFVTNAGSGNLLAPWGGVEALLGTNPIALAVPAGEEPPPVLDMAMSQVSKGKITLAAARGEASIPAGWAMNRRGETTTDTREAMEGLLVPIGGYKGAGLSFMTGLLAGVWVGGLFGRQVRDLFSDPAT